MAYRIKRAPEQISARVTNSLPHKARPRETSEARLQELQILLEISQTVLGSLDLNSVVQEILEKTMAIASFDLGTVFLFNETGGEAKVAAHRGYRDPQAAMRADKKEEPGRQRFRTPIQEPIVEENLAATGRMRTLREEGAQSAVMVPIRNQGEALGVLQLGSRKPRKFQPEEIRLLKAIGSQTGIAIQKARLYEEAQRHRLEAEELARVAKSFTEVLDTETVGRRIVQSLLQVFTSRSAILRLLQSDGSLIAVATAGPISNSIKPGHILPPGIGTAGQAITQGRPVLSSNILTDPRLAMSEDLRQRVEETESTRSALSVPLRAKGEIIGSLSMGGLPERSFSEDEIALVQAFADQAALALDNARLFDETKQRAQEFAALHAVTAAVSSSLDLQQILTKALDAVLEVSGTEVGYIHFLEGDPPCLALKVYRGISPAFLEKLQRGWRPGGKTEQIIATRRPIVLENMPPDRVGRFQGEGITAAAWVPIVSKDKVVGIINVGTRRSQTFSREKITLLESIGAPLGVAVENAWLFEEARTRETQLQESNRMLSALHSVAAAASQSLDLDRILQAAIERITEIFGFDATRIHIYNEQTDETVLRVSFEDDPARFTRARSFRRGQGIVGKVAESGKPLIFEDVETDPLYRQLSLTKVSSQLALHFFAVFPIKGKLKTLGTLSCVGAAPRKLNSGEIQLLEALADQIAVAIENSQLYEEMVKLATELARANKVKDEFLSLVSHELRTPLNVVMGYTGMIKDGLLGEINPEQEKALEKVISRARDQLTMISGILQAVQLEAGGVRVDIQEFPLGILLDQIKSNYEMPLGKEIDIVWGYPSDLPVIQTDSEKLKHIVQNLINNAIKFTPTGRVTVSARCLNGAGMNASGKQQAASNGFDAVQIAVADTGIGIAKENLPSVFERFRQVDSSETRNYGGVGMGLYIVKKFTELLGGTVEVESEPGKGSTFTITIPCDGLQSEIHRS